jgi:hypothetical protein
MDHCARQVNKCLANVHIRRSPWLLLPEWPSTR